MKVNEQLVRLCFEHRRGWARQLMASVAVSPAALAELEDMIQTAYENQPERRLNPARKAAVEIQHMFFGEPEIDAERPDASSSQPDAHVGVPPDTVLHGTTGFGGEMMIGTPTGTAGPVHALPKVRACVAGVVVETCGGPPPVTPEDGAREVFDIFRRWITKERRWTDNVAPTETSPLFDGMKPLRILLEFLERFLAYEQSQLQSHGIQGLRLICDTEVCRDRTVGG